MKAILLGIAASFFFAFTFVLNRAMDLSGGSWLWSSSLRYFFMVPLLLGLVWYRGNLRALFVEMKQRPWAWVWWSFVGFGLFYAPITFAAAYSPGWLTAGTWQITIVAGSLLVPFFQDADGRRQKIPLHGLWMSGLILLGVAVMQLQHAEGLSVAQLMFGVIPVLIAAFAYPLGNRKMMALCQGRLDAFQRTLGMTIASLPLWVIIAAIGWNEAGLPSSGQLVQTLLVAITSGVVATLLFFSATDMAKGNAQQLAAIEATQAGEVIFAVVLEMLILQAPLPSVWSNVGMALVMVGMVLHSILGQRKPLGKSP
ncbi:UNVERIFIED_CONTAM: drug/metabolite transporter (DMT)-like permease [Brevibacillus sp. OAP136]